MSIATGGCKNTPICPDASHDNAFVYNTNVTLLRGVWSYLATFSDNQTIHGHSSLGYATISLTALGGVTEQRPALPIHMKESSYCFI